MELLRDTDTFDGVGYSHIVSRTGDFILRADNPHSLLGGDNVFDTLREKTDLSEDDLEDMERNLLRGAGGRVSFSVDGELREMHYRPLDAGGWYVLSIVPPQAYTARSPTSSPSPSRRWPPCASCRSPCSARTCCGSRGRRTARSAASRSSIR